MKRMAGAERASLRDDAGPVFAAVAQAGVERLADRDAGFDLGDQPQTIDAGRAERRARGFATGRDQAAELAEMRRDELAERGAQSCGFDRVESVIAADTH